MMPTARSILAQSIIIGLPGPAADDRNLRLMGSEGLGGVILFSRNIETPAQVWELNYRLRRAAVEAERPPLFVMVDQEGGSVARLHEPFCDGPDLADLGRYGKQELYDHGARMGRELKAAGFNWNLAPVLDVHAVADGIMVRRSLGSDPEKVAELGAAFIAGQQDSGCMACAKHFPGLGRTTADTHKERPRVALERSELEAVELTPFKRAAAEGVTGVMVCHAVFEALDPDHPASLSEAIIQGVLRTDCGFDGLVLSDDLEMGALAAEMKPDQAAVQAYLAGCDLVLVCHHAELALEALDRLVDMAEAGEISQERLWASYNRIQAIKNGLDALPNDLSELSTVLSKKA
jgi:beta-N-acetylhexosaminidase